MVKCVPLRVSPARVLKPFLMDMVIRLVACASAAKAAEANTLRTNRRRCMLSGSEYEDTLSKSLYTYPFLQYCPSERCFLPTTSST
jgi:hypothetical protein